MLDWMAVFPDGESRLGRKGRQASVAFKFQRFSLPEEQTKQVILLPSQENDTTFFFPDNKIHGKWNGVIIFSISNFYCNPWPNIYVCLVLIHNPSIYCSEEIRLKRHLSSSRPPRAQAVLPLLECPVWEVRQTAEVRAAGFQTSPSPEAPSLASLSCRDCSCLQWIHPISASGPPRSLYLHFSFCVELPYYDWCCLFTFQQ